MIDPAASPIDPAIAAALDRFDVPPPGDDFVARMAVMPVIGGATLPPLRRRRLIDRAFDRRGRGAWLRRGAIGVIALGLASATAATTGFFPALHLALPARVVAFLTPRPHPKPGKGHVHHVTHPAALVPPAEAPPPGGLAGNMAPGAGAMPLVAPGLPDPELRRRQIAKREARVAVIQARLAANGVVVPKPVIRRELLKRQIAIGAALRGDTTTPLPPGMAQMRDRAMAYLAAHPRQAERMRARAAQADARQAQLRAQRQAARLAGQSAGAESAPAPALADQPSADAGPASTRPSWASAVALLADVGTCAEAAEAGEKLREDAGCGGDARSGT